MDFDRVFRLVSLQIGNAMIAHLLVCTRRSDLYDDGQACGRKRVSPRLQSVGKWGPDIGLG